MINPYLPRDNGVYKNGAYKKRNPDNVSRVRVEYPKRLSGKLRTAK